MTPPCRKVRIMPTRSAIDPKWKKLHTNNPYKLIPDPHYFDITSMAQPLRSERLKKKGAAAAASKSGSPSGTDTGLFSFIKDVDSPIGTAASLPKASGTPVGTAPSLPSLGAAPPPAAAGSSEAAPVQRARTSAEAMPVRCYFTITFIVLTTYLSCPATPNCANKGAAARSRVPR
jgi:hypothetical protein